MQAIVLLTPEHGLHPLAGCPALLPAGNAPAVEHTLRWLESSGCSEIHLVTPSGADQLNTYLSKAGWTGSALRTGTAVHVLVAPGCRTEGEALRFVEQKDFIKGDFVLFSGCLVGNADLKPAVHTHLARRAADRQAIMTLVMHSGSRGRGATQQAQQDQCLAVVDPRSHQLLKLEQGYRAGGHGVSLGTHMLSERNCIAVRTSIRLSHVYICAPEVLVLLSDNFDYQSIAGDLVPGVMAEQELGSMLHIHELARGYVERISSLASYSGVVEDVLGRWAYPFVPDNSGDQQDLCRFNRGTYVDATATLASGSRISKGSLVARGSVVDSGVRLDRTVVGSDCHVGRGASLQGTSMHAGARVDDSCRVSSAVLGEQAVVRSHAMVETGAVLAKHTVVDTAHSVPAGARVSLVQRNTDGDSDDEFEWDDADDAQIAAAEAAAAALAVGGIPEAALEFDEHVVGPFGAGFSWNEEPATAQDVLHHTLGAQSAPSECDSEMDEFTKETQTVEELGHDEDEDAQGADQFKREVAETFLRCIKERISHENALIELNGLKIAEDRTFADCARYIFTTMLSLCVAAGPSVKAEYRSLFPDVQPDPAAKEGCMELLRRINVQLKSWKSLMQRFLRSSDDQVELLLTFEEYCAEEGDFATGDGGSVFVELFSQVVKLCYDHDLLSEEAILDWANEKEHAGEEDRRFLDMCSDLIAWLEDAEEESEEDSD